MSVCHLRGVMWSGLSVFQRIEVLDLEPFGRTLVLDSKMQSCELDEAVYHEALVHPAMLAWSDNEEGKTTTTKTTPSSVFIGGGGEGATAREVLRFKGVQKVKMVDIDGTCVQVCKKHLPKHHRGALDDPRLELVIDDAARVLREDPSRYDVIIMDLADPIPGGPCWNLYMAEFYDMLRQRLNPGGVLVTQTAGGGLNALEDVMTPVHNTMKHVFGHDAVVESYVAPLLSFSDLYSFCIVQTASGARPLSSRSAEEMENVRRTRLETWTESFFYDV